MTRGSPLRATSSYISILGHTTPDDLLRNLSTNDAANGFGNRFLWLCVRRSKLLPDGGELVDCTDLATRTAAACHFGQSLTRMHRDPQARQLWHDIAYKDLSRERPGLAGSLTQRAAAQVVRLSCIYAILDHSDTVREPHLRSALSFWAYCERSAYFIFGTSTGDPIADDILRFLRTSPTGASRTAISELLKHNARSDRIERALNTLRALNLAYSVETSTGGRPAEVWFAKETK
jgi:hypothetical protein